MSHECKPWKRPSNYIGKDWTGYYSAGFGQSRDSDALERSNFRTVLWELGKVSDRVETVRESHWAVGWVEWIAIPADDHEAIRVAGELCEQANDYPVLNQDDHSELEQEDADETWANCYSWRERIAYIRKHPSQFDSFHDFADLMGCVRGKYFAGWASELIS